jgi:transcriptional regulator with XRE-family HTH domain
MIEEKIKFIRIAEKITQKELSDILGVPVRTIVSYETNSSKPSGEFILKMCNAFPEYAYWLVTGQTQVEAGNISPEIKIAEKQKISNLEVNSG